MTTRVVLECTACGETAEIDSSAASQDVRVCAVCGGRFEPRARPTDDAARIEPEVARRLGTGLDLILWGYAVIPTGLVLSVVVGAFDASGWTTRSLLLLTWAGFPVLHAVGLWQLVVGTVPGLRGAVLASMVFNALGMLLWGGSVVWTWFDALGERPLPDGLFTALLLVALALVLWTIGFCTIVTGVSRLAGHLGLSTEKRSATCAFYLALCLLLAGPMVVPYLTTSWPLSMLCLVVASVTVACAASGIIGVRSRLRDMGL